MDRAVYDALKRIIFLLGERSSDLSCVNNEESCDGRVKCPEVVTMPSMWDGLRRDEDNIDREMTKSSGLSTNSNPYSSQTLGLYQ